MLYGYGSRGEAYCKCVCECGNECIKSSYGLRKASNPPHCGCMTKYYESKQWEGFRKDLTGLRFGSLVVTEMIYEQGSHTKVKCMCDCGNEIVRVATYLTSGDTTSCGCVHRKRTSESNTKDFAGMKSDSGIIIKSRSRKNEKSQWLWNCECYCGKMFEELPARILNNHVTSCGCKKKSSRETLISNELDRLNVKYIREKTYSDLFDKGYLRFDFFIPEYNTLIEYQGEQHYFPLNNFGGDSAFCLGKKHDEMKRNYCEKNKITLVEVPYTLTNDEIKELLQTLFIRRDCNGTNGNIGTFAYPLSYKGEHTVRTCV